MHMCICRDVSTPCTDNEFPKGAGRPSCHPLSVLPFRCVHRNCVELDSAYETPLEGRAHDPAAEYAQSGADPTRFGEDHFSQISETHNKNQGHKLARHSDMICRARQKPHRALTTFAVFTHFVIATVGSHFVMAVGGDAQLRKNL